MSLTTNYQPLSSLTALGIGSTEPDVHAYLHDRGLAVTASVPRSVANMLHAEHADRQRAAREAADKRAAVELDDQQQRRIAALQAQWRTFDTEATCHGENIAFETYLRDEKYSGPGDVDYDAATEFIAGLEQSKAEAERRRDEIAAELYRQGTQTPQPIEPREPLPAHIQLKIQNGDL